MGFLDNTGLQYLWSKIRGIIGTGSLNTTNKTIIPAINELNNGLTYVDSDQLTITADANGSNIGTVNFGDRLNGYTVLGYSVMTDSISGSYHVLLFYGSGTRHISFYNRGTSQNTWKGKVRAAVKKNR